MKTKLLITITLFASLNLFAGGTLGNPTRPSGRPEPNGYYRMPQANTPAKPTARQQQLQSLLKDYRPIDQNRLVNIKTGRIVTLAQYIKEVNAAK